MAWRNDPFSGPAKEHRPLGQAARGSGALLRHVDISIEMRHAGGAALSRRRRFFALSRHTETPRELLLELNPQGTDYLAVADLGDDADESLWEPLSMILEDATHKLTRQELLDQWPADFVKPSRNTLWRWLDRGAKSNLIACEGTGRKTDPFRYWLPAAEGR